MQAHQREADHVDKQGGQHLQVQAQLRVGRVGRRQGAGWQAGESTSHA